MKMNALSALTFLLAGCVPVGQSSTNSSNHKVLRNIDYAYERQIRTILLRPEFGNPGSYLQPAVSRLGQADLRLEFDDLNTQRESYYLRIVHCNRDWSKSDLQDLDFLNDFNEFVINDFEYSVDTHIPYVHYWIDLPQVKLPGNYLAVVYRAGDKSDFVLSRRFMIYDTRISFGNERNLIGAGSIAALNQQINFTVNYRNLDIINPLENLNVTILQNHRWDNMATDIPPSFVREIEKQVEYRFFTEDRMFKGGSEFRFFDLRSLHSPGRNVASVDKRSKPFEVFIEKDRSRSGEPYSQYDDYNGNFIISNLDYNSDNFTNYANINFILASRPLPGKVYVTGAFNYWNLDDNNRMSYDSARQEYHARILLKQGWYDYQYVISSNKLPPYHLEGSHFETENYYEILVYYRPFQPRADLLIGYLRLEKNPR